MNAVPPRGSAAQILRFSCGLLVAPSLGLGLVSLTMAGGSATVARGARPGFDYNAPPHLADRHVFRIVAFGSSSTLGLGATSPSRAYPARLEAMLNARAAMGQPVEVVNRGIGGEDIRDMFKRLNSDIATRRANLVVWQTGSNDALHQVPLSLYEHHLREGVAALRASGAEVMLMEPQWCPRLEESGAVAPYLAVLQRVARETGTVLVPRYEMMRHWIEIGMATADEIIGPDHLHSTDRGYELLAEAVRTVVVERSQAFQAAMHAEVAAQTGVAGPQ